MDYLIIAQDLAVSCCEPTAWLPEEVDVWVVVVLSPSGVAPGERAEEGIGEQTGHLLLRHGDGVAGASLEEWYRLGEEQGRSRGRSKSFVSLPKETFEYVAQMD